MSLSHQSPTIQNPIYENWTMIRYSRQDTIQCHGELHFNLLICINQKKVTLIKE